MDIIRSGLGRLMTLLLCVWLASCGPDGRRDARKRLKHKRRTKDGKDNDILDQMDVNLVSSMLQRRQQERGYDIAFRPDPTATSKSGGILEEGDNGGSQQRAEPTLPRSSPDLLNSSRQARVITKKTYLKDDWCRTEPLVQRLRLRGCRSQPVVNRFCYGQCNSFYIPREKQRHRVGRRSALRPTVFESCTACRPRRFSTVQVRFRCPASTPRLRRKKVRLVKSCRCTTVVFNH